MSENRKQLYVRILVRPALSARALLILTVHMKGLDRMRQDKK